jgi:hypothetical protein
VILINNIEHDSTQKISTIIDNPVEVLQRERLYPSVPSLDMDIKSGFLVKVSLVF